MVEVYSSMEVLSAKKVSYVDFLIVNKVKSRNVISNLGAGLKSIVGGNIQGLTHLTSQVRTELLAELIQLARNKNANAIIGVRFETNELFQGMLDIVAYGTAVHFER